MLLSLRSSVLRLCLLLLALVVGVTWYRDYIEATTRRWYRAHGGGVDTAATHRPPGGSQSHAGYASSADGHGHGHHHHTIRPDGLLETDMAGRHPLWDLLEDAERQWDRMNARQSKTLEEAVAEYERRNGYAPPAGFDLWWDFAQKHNVKLVDEFDQINYDITPYLALSPKTFQARVRELDDPAVRHHFNITDGHVRYYGPQWFQGNQRQAGSMMMGFSRALPDLVLHGHEDLRSDAWIGEDFRREAEKKAKAGEYFTDEELHHFESLEGNTHRDRKNVCMPDDPIFQEQRTPETPTFISSFQNFTSPCANPRLYDTPPMLFSPRARIPRLTPVCVYSKQQPDSGLLLPSNMWDYYPTHLQTPHTWAERQGNDKLFWRGKTTGWGWSKHMGARDPSVTWRDGARPKFVLRFGNNTSSSYYAGGEEEIDVLLENRSGEGGGLERRRFNRTLLNRKWMDIGFEGSPIQCNVEDGTCGEMRSELSWMEPDAEYMRNRKKFVADLDSNYWSNEFQHKLSWGNVVLKATIYPEWNSRWLIPYYHYIPIQTDYSDVYNILAFFLGDPETGVGGHEDMAAKISERASRFVRENWRWKDMQAYLFRLMLEYARLGSDDRVAASFRPSSSGTAADLLRD